MKFCGLGVPGGPGAHDHLGKSAKSAKVTFVMKKNALD